MGYLLGIDIGTSGTKTVLFQTNGIPVASHTEEYPLFQPQNGWAEQNPEDWLHAVCATVRTVLEQSHVSPQEIHGLGLSGQMHGLVMLDEDDRVLRPAIIWCDQRTQKECDEITEILGKDRLIAITANPAITAFTAAKIRWVQKHEPEVFAKCKKILLPKDYVRYMLTGAFAGEVSDGSGMQLMDIRTRTWSAEMLKALNLREEQLPKLYESYEISGKINQFGAAQTGLAVGTPVAGGAGDQAAGAIGNGIIRPGTVSSTIGTSGVVFAYTEEFALDPQGRIQTFCHAVPNAWHTMGVTNAAGLSLKWFRDTFCSEEKLRAELIKTDPYVLMNSMAAESGVGAKGIFYLPYLMGERTPHLDPNARGVFFGLSASHTKGDMIRAVMEGVAYSLKDCLTVMEEMGIPVNTVRVSGGGGKSPLWRQMQADMFDRETEILRAAEGPALGVALLAGVGTGVYKSVPEACDTVLTVEKRCFPIAEHTKKYAHGYETYRKLYLALKELFPCAN